MKISLGTGGNQDPVEQYKQKIALLQNCSRPLQFSGGLLSKHSFLIEQLKFFGTDIVHIFTKFQILNIEQLTY